jgi:hypothetical protein
LVASDEFITAARQEVALEFASSKMATDKVSEKLEISNGKLCVANAKCHELRDELDLHKHQLLQSQNELDAAAKAYRALLQQLEIVQSERAAKVQEYENALVAALKISK